MKKLLLILLSLTLVLSFAACSDNPPETVCEHVDLDGDFKCEFCGQQVPCGDNHIDANADKKCDRCDADMPIETITIAEAITICNQAGENTTTERYYIKATVKSVTNAAYGAMIIEDATGTLSVYGSYGADGVDGYAALADKPYAGDEVLLYCTLQAFKGEPEIKSAWIIEFKHIEADISQYTEATIAEARAAETGALLKIDGVVAAITYANGKIPAGVILVDETSSIYVYDGDVAARVAVGNKITVAGAKTYWILDTEKNNAQKFDYKGCNQLENATLVDNDNGNNEFDKTWITESTVKAIMDTPVTEDITTLVYKVTALVSKVPGSGFVNYYINDLDGVTGSYVYTQCNGSDFAWLDQYDGKICTVYLTALNAKSTTSDCLFRFFPVKVEDNNYTFDTTKAAEFAVKYYGVGQFLNTYTGNPALNLVTSVDSELLGFTGATLTYSSSNTNVVSFTNDNGTVTFNCVGLGTATVTITGSYNGTTYEETVEILVREPSAADSVTVSEAINTEAGTEVIVKGIVGPSIVHSNVAGFYLVDETGVIAVYGVADIFKQVTIGNEIVIKGIRTLRESTQVCITEVEVLVNNYGAHTLPTDTVVTDKTLDEAIAAADTTKIYTVTGTVEFVSGGYSKNYKLTCGSTTVTLYGPGGEGDYSFLKNYVGQEITVDIVICNWNGKAYKVSIVAVHTDDGVIYNEYGWNKYNK